MADRGEEEGRWGREATIKKVPGLDVRQNKEERSKKPANLFAL
jgi:hypothetical protein